MAQVQDRNRFSHCAAIDFGTVSTALMVAKWKSKEYKEFFWTANDLQREHSKAPTVVLFNSSEKFLAFGYDAIDKYHGMKEEQKKNCYYFERFKMCLYTKEVRDIRRL